MKIREICVAFLVGALLPTAVQALDQKPGERRFTAYTTGYGYYDNTPVGDRISHAAARRTAGGTGTYRDPITLAVGHSLSNGRDVLDFTRGTMFYIPSLRRYFVVEDTCGDGDAPQEIPCHRGYQGLAWLDLWVGGRAEGPSATLACERAITGARLVIQHPAPHYAVSAGPILNGGCARVYGDDVALLESPEHADRLGIVDARRSRAWRAAWLASTRAERVTAQTGRQTASAISDSQADTAMCVRVSHAANRIDAGTVQAEADCTTCAQD